MTILKTIARGFELALVACDRLWLKLRVVLDPVARPLTELIERSQAKRHREAAAEYVALAELMSGVAGLSASAEQLRQLGAEHTRRATGAHRR